MTLVEDSENVGIAFAVVIAAGASTAIGGSIVFFPSLVKYANRKTLAAGLGMAAGVMIYVSFVDIFQKSMTSFQDAGFLHKDAFMSTTACFFAGVVFMICLNLLVHTVALRNENLKEEGEEEEEGSDEEEGGDAENREGPCDSELKCCGTDPEKLKNMVKSMEEDGVLGGTTEGESSFGDDTGEDIETGKATRIGSRTKKMTLKEKRRLVAMTLNTMLALALHNFPEGLATFVATMHDPVIGATMAIAIALHNIPESLCIALPLFYATESRVKGFIWAVVSGLSEPLGALVGWVILARFFSDMVYGILFGFVAGMMVIISTKELLPTAHKYDPDDKVTTNFFIIGMGIISLSLIFFVQTI